MGARLTLFGLVFLVTTRSAFAGVGSSGGGKAVVCRSESGAIQSAQLLDLYEAEATAGLTIRPSSGDFVEEYARTAVEMLRIEGRPLLPRADIESHLSTFLRNAVAFVGTSDELEQLDDVGPPVVTPAGCHLEQAATFDFERSRPFHVNVSIWNAMNAQNRAALMVHEILYQLFKRIAEEPTSRNVRQIVGLLFSTTPPPAYGDNLPARWQMCNASRDGWSPHATRFYIYPAAGGGSILRFVNLLGRNPYARIEIHIPVHIGRGVFDESVTNDGRSLIVNDVDAQFDDAVAIGPGPFGGYRVRVRYMFKEPFSVSLLDPEGRLLTHSILTVCGANSNE